MNSMSKSPSSKNDNSYKSILKGLSFFGGVQFFQILINLIRGKFVAIFLGPTGMGISSIFNSSALTLTQISSLGLNLAFVKEAAAHKDNPERFHTILQISLRLILCTAILGAIICAFAAPWLSEISFGSRDYTWQFVALAIMIFLTIEANGRMSIIQGLHKVKIISTASVIGAAAGLITGVPLYYFFGNKGIVPAMIILALTNYICFEAGLRKCTTRKKFRFSLSEHGPIARHMVTLGLILMASTLINSACSYGINVFMRAFGSLDNVGLFNAANSITNQYAGVVFSAMLLDYFPRLSAAAADNEKMHSLVNRQLEIVSLIISPLIILLIATSPLIIRVLLTQEFMSVTPLMRWMGLGILLKAIAYPTGYIAFAKNNQKLFFWLEAVVCNALYFGCAIIFYYFFGLIGIGYAMVTENALTILIYLAVNYKVYGYHYNQRVTTYVSIAVLLCAACFAASIISNEAVSYWIMASIFIVSTAFSLLKLRGGIKAKL